MPIRWWPSLTAMTDELCAPARPPEPGEEFHPAEIDSMDLPEWWEPYEDTVDAVLDGIDQPTRLSQLLARVDQLATEIDDEEPLDPRLLSAAIVHAAHRAWAARLAGRSAGDRVVIAASTGVDLDTEDIRADDLLLVPGEVTVDINEPAPAPRILRIIPDGDNADEEMAG